MVSEPQEFYINAFNLFDAIPIKAARSITSGTILDSSASQLQVQFAPNSYMFVFRFGALVFFNVARETMDSEMARFTAQLGAGLSEKTEESYLIRKTEGPVRVEFDDITLPHLTIDHLRMIALCLGQSAALDFFERSAASLLKETSSFMANLAKKARLPWNIKQMLRIIGSSASSRENVISNLEILDVPEEAWKSRELETLHRELQENFDITIRFRALEKKLTVVQDNLEILTNLVSSRRANILEMLVVALIVLEVILGIARGVG